MSRLAELQHDLQAALLADSIEPPAFIADTPPVDARARLHIYRSAYRLRLLEALGADFPGVRDAVGHHRFQTLGSKYIVHHPSSNPSLRWFGTGFPAHLAQGLPEQPWLGEMARFEWLLGEAIDDADANPVDPAQLATLAPDQWAGLRFGLHPSVRRMDCRWNTPRIWQQIRGGERWNPQPERPARPWLIWREDTRSFYRSLTADEAAAIDGMARGASFATVCAELLHWHDPDQAPAAAVALLRDLLSHALIVSINVDAAANECQTG